MKKTLIFTGLIIFSLLVLSSCNPSTTGKVTLEEPLLEDCIERAPYLSYDPLINVLPNEVFEIVIWVDQSDCSANNDIVLNLDDDTSFVVNTTIPDTIVISGSYSKENKYSIQGTISDNYGETPFYIYVYVSDTSVPEDQLRETILPLSYIPPLRGGTLDDGIRNRKIILMQGSTEERFWVDTNLIYPILIDRMNLTDEDIIFLAPSYDVPESLDEFDSEWIDDIIEPSSIVSAFESVASELDGDDLLFVSFDGHGSGYYGSRTRRPYYNGVRPTNIYQGPISVEELNYYDDPDFQESSFQTELIPSGRVNCVKYDGTDISKGLDKFLPCFDYYPHFLNAGDSYYRFKIVSHFENLTLTNGSIVSNDDVYIEKIINYAKCDTNRDTIIGEDEINNCDWSGIEMDGIDWSSNYTLIENYRPYYKINNNYYCFFDLNLDNTLDLMVFDSTSDPEYISCINRELDEEDLIVFASDTDNNGYSNYYDINGDGDLDDWLSFDESLSVRGTLYDDELSELMSMINENTTKIFLTMSCFGGGMLRDISSKNVISMSASEEEDTSSGNGFIRNFYNYFNECESDVDLNNDNLCSISEVFTKTYEERVSFDFPLFDDNFDLTESYGDELVLLSEIDDIFNQSFVPEGIYGDTVFLEQEFFGNISEVNCYDYDGPLNFDEVSSTIVIGEIFLDVINDNYSIDYACNGISLISFSNASTNVSDNVSDNVSFNLCPTYLSGFSCFSNAESCENINGQILQSLSCSSPTEFCCWSLFNTTNINDSCCSQIIVD